MAVAMKIACIVLVCMVAVSVTEAITCGQVVNNLGGCVTYLQKGGKPTPGCCSGVKNLVRAAGTTADRRTACGCLKIAGKQFKANPNFAAALPGACGVRIPYPISSSTDCSKIN